MTTAGAACYDKVELRSRTDLLAVEQLLDEAVDAYLQTQGNGNEELRHALRVVSNTVMNNVKQFVTCGDGPHGTPPAPPRSPQLKPLAPPPVDAEVCALEGEVAAAAGRIAALRAAAEDAAAERAAAEMEAARPSAELPPRGAPAAPAPPPAAADPPAEELAARLAAAAAALPALRARLEEAASRVDRVASAVAAEAARPPPRTVERVVLGGERAEGGAPAADAAGADAAPAAFRRALESGRLETRRRATRGGGELRPFDQLGEDGPGDDEGATPPPTAAA